jgi:uncharacterized SAM-binding protein YcdF (DUF218 family)
MSKSIAGNILPRAVFWLIFISVVVIAILWRQDIADNQLNPSLQYSPEKQIPESPPDIVLYLSSAKENKLTTKELSDINSAADYWVKGNQKGWIAVVSENKLKGFYAKVILHSYGLDNFNFKVLPDLSSIKWQGGNTAVLSSMPENISERIKNQKVSLASVPVIKLKILPVNEAIKKAVVVPGNQPLDSSTPGIDLIKRTLKAVQFYANNPDAVLIFSGAATVSGISESRMMSLIARSRGVPENRCVLEEKATSTHQNAIYTAEILTDLKRTEITLISKKSHLDTAVPVFQKQRQITKVTPLKADVTEKEILTDMKQYLKYKNDPIVEGRMKVLELGQHGVD